MELGGWKIRSVAEHYIEPTTSAASQGKRRKLDGDLAAADKFPLSLTGLLNRLRPVLDVGIYIECLGALQAGSAEGEHRGFR